jgi:predicted  nucleic acid-binding Zn-ribbon protein
MLSLDQMSEKELLAELHRIADACERLDHEVARATNRQQFGTNSGEVTQASQDAQTLLAEMSRAMDRRRAIEGRLMQVRGRSRSLKLDEQVISGQASPNK